MGPDQELVSGPRTVITCHALMLGCVLLCCETAYFLAAALTFGHVVEFEQVHAVEQRFYWYLGSLGICHWVQLYQT